MSASPATQPRNVSRVGVLGAGTMGAGIAANLGMAGFEVTLVDTNPAALGAGVERVRSFIGAAVDKGRLAPQDAELSLARVRQNQAIDALREMDLVIEAVFESLAVKQEVFAALGKICRQGAVLSCMEWKYRFRLWMSMPSQPRPAAPKTSSACTSSARRTS